MQTQQDNERYTVGEWSLNDMRGYAVYWRGQARFTSPRRDVCVRKAAEWNKRLAAKRGA